VKLEYPLLLLGTAIGCASGSEGEGREQRTTTKSERAPTAQTVRADSVVATHDGDTVAIVGDGKELRLRWSSYRNGGAIQRWQSRPLGFAKPSVRLTLISSDSAPDLFWTIAYEDQVGGQLLTATDTGAEVAFSVGSAESCAEPELRDVTSDGLMDIIEYRPDALTADECHGDALAEVCMAGYPLSWAVVRVQKTNGSFVDDPNQASEFYRRQSGRYGKAAESLRTSLKEGVGPPARSSRCNESLATALEDMAKRADRRAKSP